MAARDLLRPRARSLRALTSTVEAALRSVDQALDTSGLQAAIPRRRPTRRLDHPRTARAHARRGIATELSKLVGIPDAAPCRLPPARCAVDR